MAAVRLYDQPTGTATPRPSQEKPDEESDVYQGRITALFSQGNFAELEKIAAENRVQKGRLLGGVWREKAFYDGVSSPSRPWETDYISVIQIIQRWLAAHPDSEAAHIAKAEFYVAYAWHARGPGLANTVSDSQWSVFYDRLARAATALVEASLLKDRDAEWYCAMLQVAQGQGWPKEETRELFDRGVGFEPMYYHTYRYYSLYLLPRWYGDAHDIPALADETYERFPGADGAWLYFEIASTYTCYCDRQHQDVAMMSFGKLLQGWNAMRNLYGVSNLKANRFAYMAVVLRQKSFAKEAFGYITQSEESIWGNDGEFEKDKAWATQ